METLRLRIITPEGEVVAAECGSVTIPSACGELQILPGHCNYVGLIGTGLLSYTSSDNITHYGIVSDGSCEAALSGNCVLLVETWLPADQGTVASLPGRFAEVSSRLALSDLSPSDRATCLGFQLAYKKLAELQNISLA